MKNFMSKKVQDMTVGESIRYSGLMRGIGILLTALVYGGIYIYMKVTDKI